MTANATQADLAAAMAYDGHGPSPWTPKIVPQPIESKPLPAVAVAPRIEAPGKLTERDLAMFAVIGVPPNLLKDAGVERVTDRDARERFGIRGPASRNMAGLVFPYYSHVTRRRVACRVRRDNPEVEDSKPKNKYVSAYGDRRHLYFVPGCTELVSNPSVPIILGEAEKSALALTALAIRSGRDILAVGPNPYIGRGYRLRGESSPERGCGRIATYHRAGVYRAN